MTTARVAIRLVATRGFPLSDRINCDFGQMQKGEFRADGAPPFVRVTWSLRPHAQSDSFALAKESRGSGGGFLKGGTVGDSLKRRLFWYFSLDEERKVQKRNPPINRNFPNYAIGKL